MIIIGAKGFAKELLQVLDDSDKINNEICFFDDISNDLPDLLYGQFRILRSYHELQVYFENKSPEFILGIGGPLIRQELCRKVKNVGGKVTSLISKTASIGHFGTILEEGLCVMRNTIIENDVIIREGSLIHNGSIISHDVNVGKYCEISPGAKLLGRAEIGDFCHIGSNAVVLPDIRIGSSVYVGAGAVVTKDVPDNKVVVGIPARPMLER